MANDVVNSFQGLPMDQLIAAPFKAACSAQLQLSGAAWEYMQKIGFEKDQARLLKFSLERPVETPLGIQTNTIEVQAPFLGLVPIPSLLIDDMTVDFQMEVTATTQDKDTTNAESSVDVTYKSPWGLSASVHGKVSTSKENTRSTNQTAKYQIHVQAKQQPQTEGLSKLMDILASCTAPLKVEGVK